MCLSVKRELRNSKLLSLTEVLNDISTHTIIPLLPLFIIQVLGASPFILGLIEGWAQVASTMAHLGSQWFNAQFKEQKRTLLFANALSSVSKAGYAFSSTWPAVLVFRCTDMASSTLSTNSIDALFASKSREFSAASAFRATIGHVGAIIGPFFAALLLIF